MLKNSYSTFWWYYDPTYKLRNNKIFFRKHPLNNNYYLDFANPLKHIIKDLQQPLHPLLKELLNVYLQP